MKRFLLLISCLFCLHSLLAQTTYSVSGQVNDSTGQQLIGASILLIAGRDTLHTASNDKGIFIFPKVEHTSFTLRIFLMGYKSWYQSFTYREVGTDIHLPMIKLAMNQLQEVTIKGRGAAVIVKEDTLEYKVDQYKLRNNAVIEDLLKRLPGIQVDQDGNISTLGKKITKVRINGKDFVIDDIKSLTRLLPVDMIDKLQVIEDYGNMARATGRKNGSPQPIINLKTKAGIGKAYQGKANVGVGNDGRYDAGIMLNTFGEKQQFSIIGHSNNISPQTGRVTNSIGNINYRNNITKTVTLTTGLNVTHNISNQLSSSEVQTITSEGPLYIANNGNTRNSTDNYNVLGGLEYKPNEKTFVDMKMNASNSSSIVNSIQSAKQTGFQQKDQQTKNYLTSSTPNISGSVFASHKLNDKGRAIALNLSVRNSGDNSEQESYDSLRYYTVDNGVLKDSLLHQQLHKENGNLNTNAELSFIEPLNKTSNLELKYTFSSNGLSNKLETEWINSAGTKTYIDSLSNSYTFTTIQHQVEVNYLHFKGKLDYTIGARLQPSLLKSSVIAGKREIKRSMPLIPVLSLQYKLRPQSLLMMMYSGHMDFPSYQQLLPIPDLTNAQFPVVGNPDLHPSFTHTMSMGYRSGGEKPFFVVLTGSYIKDNIVTNVVLVKDSFNTVKQETRYLNVNGTYNAGIDYDFSKRFGENKFVIDVSGNSTYNKNILFLDNLRKNSRNLSFTQTVRLSMYQRWLEVRGTANYMYTHNVYELTESNTTDFSTLNFGLHGKAYFLKTFSIGADVRKQLSYGYSADVNINPLFVNGVMEKTFFQQKLTCRLQGFNLLNEKASLSQAIAGNTVTQSRNQLAGRYFMLSLQCDLKLLKGKTQL